jgi:hypothetical protein
MLRFRALSGVRKGRFGSSWVAFGTTRPVFAALLCLALAGCAPIADRACDELRAAVDSSRIVVDFTPIDGCGYLLQYVTAAPGSLSLEGCTDVAEAAPFACGYTYAVECPLRLDAHGTVATVEIVGDIRIDPGDPLAGPVGLADVTVTHPDGWVVCEGQYGVDAWPHVEP